MPDFGEPWHYRELTMDKPGGHCYDRDYNIVSRFGPDIQSRRIVQCVNACAGMTDPAAEIQAMREAIREAHEALGGCMKYILKLPLSGSDLECEVMDDAHHALRKLKPFLP